MEGTLTLSSHEDQCLPIQRPIAWEEPFALARVLILNQKTGSEGSMSEPATSKVAYKL